MGAFLTWCSSAFWRLRKAGVQTFDVRYWPSYFRLSAYRDKHAGETCVIVGNGPSLRNTDLSLLQGIPTFGLNRIYLGGEDLGFTPTFLVCVNNYVLEQCWHEIRELEMPKFVQRTPHTQKPGPNTIFLRLGRVHRSDFGFSTDPVNGLWISGTVTYVAMQLAFWMGFTRVLLVGVDHAFETQGPPNKLVVSEGDDPNHFNKQYFGKGFRWQLPDLAQSEVSYRIADWCFRNSGREIIDCTVGGKCPVFRKSVLEQELCG